MGFLDKLFHGSKKAPREPPRVPLERADDGQIVYDDDLAGAILSELERRRDERMGYELCWTLNADFLAGHQNTEIRGAKEATATEPGYTGDTYCHDCKTVVAKGKEIPVKAPEGQGPSKTDDPFFFGMGLVVMMTSVSAMAVLTVVYKKKYRA